jgi:hypothetical protein
MQQTSNTGVSASNWRRTEIYRPNTSPAFVAWATAFDYGDGRIGLSFKESAQLSNPWYRPPKLEFGEAVGAPVSYCSVECGSPDLISWRVYMVSEDNGETFRETGRCNLEEGSFCNVGFPDGRILGVDVPRINNEGTGWCECIQIRESLDGGSTWSTVAELLEGCAPYAWRVKRLKDGTIVLCASLYGTPWGEGKARTTRNTMLPGETYLNKIQTFFMTSSDGKSWDGPHYILPGTGAHEFDFVELRDGSLLFIAGDVQATPVARQIVKRQNGRYINGTLMGIRHGAPPDPANNPQGGFVPEAIVILQDGLIVGSRRNRPYSCSNDLGENWTEIEGLPPSLYQPYMMMLPNGTVANFGHLGGDSGFGQQEMLIGADIFTLDNHLPKALTLSLKRTKDSDNSRYLNAFSATLSSGSKPVAGAMLDFRFNPVWREDGAVNTLPQEQAPVIKHAATDQNGVAHVAVPEFNGIGDIHFYYNADVVFQPKRGSTSPACDGPMMCAAALTPMRNSLYPHAAYFAEGKLFLSPQTVADYPELLEALTALAGRQEDLVPEGTLTPSAAELLLSCGVLRQTPRGLCWIHSVHAPVPLAEVKVMEGGDWYV